MFKLAAQREPAGSITSVCMSHELTALSLEKFINSRNSAIQWTEHGPFHLHLATHAVAKFAFGFSSPCLDDLQSLQGDLVWLVEFDLMLYQSWWPYGSDPYLG